jgi:molybdopterin synthase sulfur carrier subunit
VKVDVLYFAGLREAVGTARESVELPAGVATAAALRAYLRARGGEWAEALAETRTLRVAVDQAMAGAEAPLRDGAEVAFFPPVTGG